MSLFELGGSQLSSWYIRYTSERNLAKRGASAKSATAPTVTLEKPLAEPHGIDNAFRKDSWKLPKLIAGRYSSLRVLISSRNASLLEFAFTSFYRIEPCVVSTLSNCIIVTSWMLSLYILYRCVRASRPFSYRFAPRCSCIIVLASFFFFDSLDFYANERRILASRFFKPFFFLLPPSSPFFHTARIS